jgi:hypothetical protein
MVLKVRLLNVTQAIINGLPNIDVRPGNRFSIRGSHPRSQKKWLTRCPRAAIGLLCNILRMDPVLTI